MTLPLPYSCCSAKLVHHFLQKKKALVTTFLLLPPSPSSDSPPGSFAICLPLPTKRMGNASEVRSPSGMRGADSDKQTDKTASKHILIFTTSSQSLDDVTL